MSISIGLTKYEDDNYDETKWYSCSAFMWPLGFPGFWVPEGMTADTKEQRIETEHLPAFREYIVKGLKGKRHAERKARVLALIDEAIATGDSISYSY